ncbi:MAG: hypothetical protein WBB35_12650 [Saprospiraceae bacterium]
MYSGVWESGLVVVWEETQTCRGEEKVVYGFLFHPPAPSEACLSGRQGGEGCAWVLL